MGRKKPIFMGFGIFILGCLLSLFAPTYPIMLAGRVLQGLGMAGPRAVSTALVRDLYEGDKMAKVMSYVMTVFILVPMIAPAYGQTIIAWAGWRAIFASFIGLSVLICLWFAFRQAETLVLEKRKPFSMKRILYVSKEVITTKVAFAYTLAAGLISGAFLGYLNSAQQIFQDQYQLGNRFPLYFAIIALGIGAASFVNAQLVMRYGMKRLAKLALNTLTVLSVIAFVIAFAQQGNPPLWQLMTYLMTSFFCVGILFGNLNALAMEPLGHVAGIGAAIVGSLSTFISVPLGIWVGLSYNNTILPLITGLVVLGALSIVVMRWAES